MGGAKKVICLFLMALGTVDDDISVIRALTSNDQISLISGKLPTPKAGKLYTIQYLFDLVNAKNKRKISNFLIPIGTNNQPIDNDHCWQSPLQIVGSESANIVGLNATWVQKNGSQTVVLFQDQALVDFLSDQKVGVLSASTKQHYQKILLYFLFPVTTQIKNPKTGTSQRGTVYYRCYLNDPFPGVIKRNAVVTVNPAADIIKKWNV